MESDTMSFVAIGLPGEPSQEVWEELDRLMAEIGFHKEIGDGYVDIGSLHESFSIMLPRGVYVCEETYDESITIKEDVDPIVERLWPHRPVVFAFQSDEFWGRSREEEECQLRETFEGEAAE